MNLFFKPIYCVLFVMLILGYKANSQGVLMDWEKLANKTHAERTVLLSNYYKGEIARFDSLTVRKHIQQLEKLAAEFDDPALYYEAKCIRGHYFYFSDHIPDEVVLDSLFSVLRVAERDNVLWLRVRMESLIGHYNFNGLKEYERGTIHLARAAELLDQKSPNEYPLKQVCNYHIGIALYSLNDFDNALKYLRIASLAPAYEGMTDYKLDVFNTIGVIQRGQNDLDSSDLYFLKAMKLGKESGNEQWVAIASGNLGENHFLRGEYEKAIPLLQKDAEVNTRHMDWGVASNALTLLGDIELKRGNIVKADSLLQKALKFSHRSNDYKRLEAVFPRMAKLKSGQNEVQLSALYIDSALLVSDSLDRKERKLLSARSQQKLESERYVDRLSLLELEKEKKVLERNLMFAIGLGILILAILLYNALWSKYMLKNKQLKKSEEELELSRKRLIEITENLAERNVEIDRLQARPSNIDTEGIQELQKKTILTEEDWDSFRDLFEKTFPNFLVNLQTKEANLTQAEIRFLALKKLEVSPKKIAGVLGVGDGAIRQYRYRIRKKIGVNDLEEFINSI